jgi:hypothetical protein
LTLPIVGGFRKFEVLTGVANDLGYKPQIREYERKWSRQQKPYDLPLNFDYRLRYVRSYSSSDSLSGAGNRWYVEYTGIPASVTMWPELYAKAFNKFKDKIGANASLGVSLAESRQSLGMVTNRLLQLARFTNSLRKGRFRDAAVALGVQDSPQWKRLNRSLGKNSLKYRTLSKIRNLPDSRPGVLRKGSKHFANNFLEFHFGWKPAIQDIYDTLEVLEKPVKGAMIKASAKLKLPARSKEVINTSSDSGYRQTDQTWAQTVTLQAEVAVSNANFASLQQVGLINPATVIWETIPFSFVLDWFVNVGDFLDSFTAFAGLTLKNQQRTVYTEFLEQWSEYILHNKNSKTEAFPGDPFWASHRYSERKQSVREGVYVNRLVGTFPYPPLHVRPPKVWSPGRGLAAVSLIIQRMPRHTVEAARPVISSKRTSFRGKLTEGYWHL